MIKDEVGMGKLVERLRAWLVKRGQPDSGMHYQSNAAHGFSRVELYAADADFVARHFHGSGAVSLADALTALIAERDALAKALKPFADIADEIERDYGADTPDAQMQFPVLQMRLFRTARSTLNLTVNHDG